MERKFKVKVDGKSYDVQVEDITEGTSLLFPDAGSMQVPAPAQSAPAAAAASSAASAPAGADAGPGDEVSPLAGVVRGVHVNVGQSVSEGDKIITLEAMKMKTVVVAHRSGKVSNVAVKDGDAVDTGQVLLTIE